MFIAISALVLEAPQGVACKKEAVRVEGSVLAQEGHEIGRARTEQCCRLAQQADELLFVLAYGDAFDRIADLAKVARESGDLIERLRGLAIEQTAHVPLSSGCCTRAGSCAWRCLRRTSA